MDKEGNEQAHSKMRPGEHGKQEAKEATTETKGRDVEGRGPHFPEEMGSTTIGRETSWHIWGSVPKPHRQRSPDTQ